MGPDGMPQSSDPWFQVLSSTPPEPLRAKTDLDCQIVDEDGNRSGEDVIPAGDTFEICRTDGETFLDVRLTDGRIARLKVTSSGYPCEINGLVDQEVVEQTWYAG